MRTAVVRVNVDPESVLTPRSYERAWHCSSGW